MAQSTPLDEGSLSRAPSEAAAPPLEGAAARLKHALRRAIFWSYERGSWQYDVIVILILAFIFLSRPLFQDRPTMQLTDLRHVPGVVEVSRDKTSHTYQIDARLMDSLNAPTLQEGAQAILAKSLKRTVEVKSVEPIMDRNRPNVILGYVVKVEP